MSCFSPLRLRVPLLCLGTTAVLGVATYAGMPAFQRHLPPVNGDTPAQVAQVLDRLVQPRFEQNAGQFGVDRVVNLDGHTGIHSLDAGAPGERRLLREISASHRSVIVAFFHVRHKPGAHVNPKAPPEALDLHFHPSVEALATIAASNAGVNRNLVWADRTLTRVASPSLPALRRGQGQAVDYQNWLVVMRPVRATHESCLNCHAGARRGDTLGVMVYAVDKNRKIGSENFAGPSGP